MLFCCLSVPAISCEIQWLVYVVVVRAVVVNSVGVLISNCKQFRSFYVSKHHASARDGGVVLQTNEI